MTDTLATADVADAGATTPAQTTEEATKTDANIELSQTSNEADGEGGEKDVGDDARDRKPSGYQRMREKALRAEMEAARVKAELDEVRKQLGDKAPVPGLPPEPKEADFPDFFEYQSAKAGWYAEKLRLQSQTTSRETESRVSAEMAREEALERVEQSHNRAAETFEDFHKVMNDFARSGSAVSPALVQEVMSSDKAGLINYHLCKPENRALLRELNQLDGKELVRAVARLEGRYSWPRAKTETRAPAPLSNVTGGAAPARSLAEMSYEEYRKTRMA